MDSTGQPRFQKLVRVGTRQLSTVQKRFRDEIWTCPAPTAHAFAGHLKLVDAVAFRDRVCAA